MSLRFTLCLKHWKCFTWKHVQNAYNATDQAFLDKPRERLTLDNEDDSIGLIGDQWKMHYNWPQVLGVTKHEDKTHIANV